MANELSAFIDETGLTIVADLVQGATTIQSAVAMAERGATGHYYGDFPAVAAGAYDIFYRAGSTIKSVERIWWDGLKERFENLTSSLLSNIADAVWSATTRALTDKAGFELSAQQETDLAVTIETALLNEGDGQALLQAIIDKINNDLDISGVELAAISSAIRTELAPELARLDVNVSSRSSFDSATDEVNANIVKVTDTAVTDVTDFHGEGISVTDISDRLEREDGPLDRTLDQATFAAERTQR